MQNIHVHDKYIHFYVSVRVCVCVCVRACARACVCVCVCELQCFLNLPCTQDLISLDGPDKMVSWRLCGKLKKIKKK